MRADALLSDPLLENAPVRESYKVLGGVVIYQKLGQGGMGAVYRGRHLRLNVDVAVKVMVPPARMPPDQAEAFLKRFIREAQTAAAVHHSNLIRVYDVDSEHGVHFLIMNYVDGESGGDRLKRKGRLTEEEAVEISLGAAEGLAEAHAQGIVHRDVKPDNVLIDKKGRVQVADLGLAKAFAGEEAGEPLLLTQTQQAIGTPHYMSPEQFESARDVGPATDVWSLGATLYQLVTGRLPWEASSVFTLAEKIRHDPLSDPKQVCGWLSDGVCAVIHRALSKPPEDRYADCGQMAKALRRHLSSLAADPEESVLPDPEVGTTKLALVSVTPPPQETLTLIGSSVVEEGGRATPPSLPPEAGGEVASGTPPSEGAVEAETPLAARSDDARHAAAPGGCAGTGVALMALVVLIALLGGGAAIWYALGRGRESDSSESAFLVEPRLSPSKGRSSGSGESEPPAESTSPSVDEARRAEAARWTSRGEEAEVGSDAEDGLGYSRVPSVPEQEIVRREETTIGLVPLKLDLPRPAFIGVPRNVPPGTTVQKPTGKPRLPFMAPADVVNVAFGKPVSASNRKPTIGEIKMVTDGDKEAKDGSYVELGSGLQWVQIDLKETFEIFALLFWNYHGDPRVYQDIIVQVADDPDYIAGVQTVFNNDHDNSAGLGIGKGHEYFETYEGKLVDAKGVKARYVRVYANGSTADLWTRFTEVEVYGRRAK